MRYEESEDEEECEEDQELDHYEEQIEFAALEPREWHEGLALDPCVGGVHLGKVPLKMFVDQGEDEATTRLKVRKARSRMLVQGGQVYIPFFKKLSQKNGINNLRHMGALPAMVTNLMLPDIIHESSMEEKKTLDSLISQLNYIDKLVAEEMKITEGNNCIRMEFFYDSKLSQAEKDWKFPRILPWKFCSLSQQSSYFKTYASISEEVNSVLSKSILNQTSCNYDGLHIDAKRMIILCSEIVTSMTELMLFCPKAMDQVNRIVDLDNQGAQDGLEGSELIPQEEDDDQESELDLPQESEQQDGISVGSLEEDRIAEDRLIFNVPKKYLTDLDPSTKMATGLPKGLSATILPLPKYQPTRQLQRNDMRERNRAYLQGFLNQSTKQTSLMNHYTYAVGKILSILWSYSDPTNTNNRSLLELPSFKKLAELPDARKQLMVEELTKILANTYDFEWWWIVRTKTNHFASERGRSLTLGKAHLFPKTTNEVDQLLSYQEDLRLSKRYSRRVTSVGKF